MELRTLPREMIHAAPYNPRQIDAAAQVKLANGLAEYGMVETLVWNKRTGNLVGGHQRLRLMDQQAGTARGYSVQVSVVDLDERGEKTLNVLLNNEGAQGWWDSRKLAELFASDKTINVEDMGFDLGQIRIDLQRNPAATEGLDLSHLFPQEADSKVTQDAEKIATMKANKADHKVALGEVGQDGYYVRFVFPSVSFKERTCIALGLSPNTKDALGTILAKVLGVPPDAPAEPPTVDIAPQEPDDDGRDDFDDPAPAGGAPDG